MTISLEYLDKIRASGFRPGIVGCFVYQKKVLFMYAQKHNLWQLPQGGIDNGETIKEAIFREFKEELGDFLQTKCEHNFYLFGENKVEFPSKDRGYKELKTDDGTQILMLGKKYYFIMIPVIDPDIHIKKTEFDDYQWLDYNDAILFSKRIYQKGKRRVTVQILDLMKLNEMIE